MYSDENLYTLLLSSDENSSNIIINIIITRNLYNY
jgi:hypothetical protein